MKLKINVLKKLRGMLVNFPDDKPFDMRNECQCLGGYGLSYKILKQKSSFMWEVDILGFENLMVWYFLFGARWSQGSRDEQIADCIGRIDALLAGYVDWEYIV